MGRRIAQEGIPGRGSGLEQGSALLGGDRGPVARRLGGEDFGVRGSLQRPRGRRPPWETARAAALVEAAAAACDADPAQAEALLRDGLTADLFHAEAHDNLGVLLLARGDLDGAAREFELARKLLPGHPEPRLNLALTLERAGQAQAAEASYAAALEVHPGYMSALQGAARLALAEGRPSAALPQWLAEIALGGETEE